MLTKKELELITTRHKLRKCNSLLELQAIQDCEALLREIEFLKDKIEVMKVNLKYSEVLFPMASNSF